MKIVLLQLAKFLVPQLQLDHAIEDRKRNAVLSNMLLNDELKHLPDNHEFRIQKRLIRKQQQKFLLYNYLHSIGKIAKYCWSILQVILWTLMNNHPNLLKKEIVIIKGLGYQQVNPHFSHEEIIDSIPIDALQNEDKQDVDFILISSFAECRSSKFIASENIFQTLLLIEKPSFNGLIRFLLQANLLGILALLNSDIRKFILEIPSALLLANFKPHVEFLTFIDTQSSFVNLDLFYYVSNNSLKIKSVMIHYSEGGMPFTRMQLEKSLFIYTYELAPVTTHVVWTDEYAQFFNLRGRNKNFIALGPQVFRSSYSYRNGLQVRDEFQLAVFDETPSLHDEPYNHLREEAGLAFLDAIEILWDDCHAKLGLNLEICFKQKRRNLEIHSKRYLKKLDTLIANRTIRLVPWHENPLEMIGRSDSVLTVLGSSPALMGRHLQRPTAYGYFGGLELGDPLINYGIPIILNYGDLIKWIHQLAKDKKT